MSRSVKNGPSERGQLSSSAVAVAGIHDPQAGQSTENSPQRGRKRGELFQSSHSQAPLDSARVLNIESARPGV